MTSGRGLPPAWTGPEWRSAVGDLLELYQFSAARDVLVAVGAPARAVGLATLGDALLNLDVHDAGLADGLSAAGPELHDRITAVMWPTSRSAAARGPLADLAPTYELLLEVMHVHMLRGEWSSVLAVLHLMAEYLPLLAWSGKVGDAGDPLVLAARVSAPGAGWHSDACPLNRAERAAFESISTGGDWDDYLRDRHSRVASALAVCAGVPSPVLTENSSRACRRQCSVMEGVTGLAWRMTLARRFRDCALLQLRHDAPVGHFFSVPGPSQIEAAWQTTWHGIVADGVETPAGENPATGMQPADWVEGVSGLLGLVAGRKHALAPATLLAELGAQVRLEVAHS